jgi:hypothetical protein
MNILPQRESSIGEILGQGLSDIAGHWAGIRTSEKAFKGLGFSPAEAKAYAHLSPQIQQQAIQSRQHEQQQAASNQAISQILNAGLGGEQPQYAQASSYTQGPSTSIPKRSMPHEQQQEAIQQATGIAQNPAFRKLQEQQQGAQALQQQQVAQNFGPQANRPTAEQQAILQAQAIEAQKAQPSIKQQLEQVRNQKRALSAANLPANQAIALHSQLEAKEKELRREAREERKEALEEKKLSATEQRAVDKETLPTYKEVNDKAKASKDSNIRLGRMEELINKGNLSSAAFYNGIKALGKIPGIGGYIESIAESFLSPDTQEFEKLSTDFIKDAKQFFGNRITQQEVNLFLKTVPNLSQTGAGKRRVIRNMRIFNEAAGLRKKTMDEIIKENGGKRPANLESLIEERSAPQLDALAAEFKGSGA